MATIVVPPVIPTALPGRGAGSGPDRRARGPLPVPALNALPAQADPTVYALSAVDKSGRVADRGIVRVLGWRPGTRLHVREHAGLITICAAIDGVHHIDERGHLRLPLAARRWCHLATGDRILLAASPAAAVLVAYPLPLLDRLLATSRLAMAGDAA